MARGLVAGAPPEPWNAERPELLAAIHDEYIAAGARVLSTNTFGATRERMAKACPGADAADLARRGAAIARACADAASAQVFVAGDMGPTGETFPPVGTATEAALEAAFREQAAALLEGGVDAFLIETMFDLREALIALRACRAIAPAHPVIVTLTYRRTRRGYFTIMGDKPAAACDALGEGGAAMVGANCTLAPEEMGDLVTEMRQHTSLPLLFQANAGQPTLREGRAVYPMTEEEFAARSLAFFERGATAVGGCCGSTPAALARLAAAARERGFLS
jgi:methionine synthase I (cobalamin-dependent)